MDKIQHFDLIYAVPVLLVGLIALACCCPTEEHVRSRENRKTRNTARTAKSKSTKRHVSAASKQYHNTAEKRDVEHPYSKTQTVHPNHEQPATATPAETLAQSGTATPNIQQQLVIHGGLDGMTATEAVGRNLSPMSAQQAPVQGTPMAPPPWQTQQTYISESATPQQQAYHNVAQQMTSPSIMVFGSIFGMTARHHQSLPLVYPQQQNYFSTAKTTKAPYATYSYPPIGQRIPDYMYHFFQNLNRIAPHQQKGSINSMRSVSQYDPRSTIVRIHGPSNTSQKSSVHKERPKSVNKLVPQPPRRFPGEDDASRNKLQTYSATVQDEQLVHQNVLQPDLIGEEVQEYLAQFDAYEELNVYGDGFGLSHRAQPRAGPPKNRKPPQDFDPHNMYEECIDIEPKVLTKYENVNAAPATRRRRKSNEKTFNIFNKRKKEVRTRRTSGTVKKQPITQQAVTSERIKKRRRVPSGPASTDQSKGQPIEAAPSKQSSTLFVTDFKSEEKTKKAKSHR